MAKRITEYTNIETIAESDVLPIVDVSDTEQASTGSTRKGTVGKIADYIKDRAETLTNKILTTARLNTPKINEDVTVTATSTELNKLDGMAGDAVGTTDTQTLTNKTLTAPALSSPTISGAWDGWISAGETWTYASADDPTYTFTVAADVTGKYSVGMKIKLTQGTVKYFIITAVSTYSGGNTTITVYGGTDYDLASAAISSNYYSTQKAPQGFPLDPDKWTEEVTDSTRRTQTSPVNGTYYNLGSINLSVPIGAWELEYHVPQTYAYTAVTTENSLIGFRTALSTGSSSASDDKLTDYREIRVYINAERAVFLSATNASNTVSVASKTTYYLNAAISSGGGSGSGIRFDNDLYACTVRATCAYL